MQQEFGVGFKDVWVWVWVWVGVGVGVFVCVRVCVRARCRSGVLCVVCVRCRSALFRGGVWLTLLGGTDNMMTVLTSFVQHCIYLVKSNNEQLTLKRGCEEEA